MRATVVENGRVAFLPETALKQSTIALHKEQQDFTVLHDNAGLRPITQTPL